MQQHFTYDTEEEEPLPVRDREQIHHLANKIGQEGNKRQAGEKPPQRFPCIACGSDLHFVTGCEKFYLMNPTERRRLAAEKGACYICIATTHRSKDCPKREFRKCIICKGKHHLLLHPAANTVQHNVDQGTDHSDSGDSDANYVSCAYQQSRKPKRINGLPALETVITYLTVWITNPESGRKLKVNLLADSGANSCSLDTELGRKLGLQGQAQPYHVQVGGGRINTYAAFGATVLIQGVQEQAEEFNIQVQVYDTPCGSLGAVNWAEQKKSWSHLKDLDLPTAAEGNVDGIIGMSEPTLIAAINPAVMGQRHEPVATKTKLGWFVGGPTIAQSDSSHMTVSFINQHLSQLPSISESYEDTRSALQRFWAPENYGTDPLNLNPAPTTQLERRATAVFKRTLTRLENGQYQVGLLWRNGFFVPKNAQEALRMFRKLEEQLDANPTMREKL